VLILCHGLIIGVPACREAMLHMLAWCACHVACCLACLHVSSHAPHVGQDEFWHLCPCVHANGRHESCLIKRSKRGPVDHESCVAMCVLSCSCSGNR